jgi:hypothetical protein
MRRTTMSDRAFLVYAYGEDGPSQLVPFKATLTLKPRVTPQLHVLQANIEKRFAPVPSTQQGRQQGRMGPWIGTRTIIKPSLR